MLPRLPVAVLVSALVAVGSTPAASALDRDPRLTRELYVDQGSQPFHAAQEDHRFDPIATTPMARWFTDAQPPDTVRKQVRRYARAAEDADRTPVVVVYAIPHRDCGGYSSGGFTRRTYRTWVRQLAAGLKGTHALAVLEPDALPALGACDGQRGRLGLLRFATTTLAKAGAWVYLDAGHSGWVEPDEMADRLLAAGVDRARGFSLNVSNVVHSRTERTYAKQISRVLADHGVRPHYVIDTSRNGGPTIDPADWCNPQDARPGQQPRVVGRRLDAYLWVKTPGESDGPCHDGPTAGTWWPEYALRLMGLSEPQTGTSPQSQNQSRRPGPSVT